MNAREKFLTTFKHQEPDCVPVLFSIAMPGFFKQWKDQYEDLVEEEDIVVFAGFDHTMAKQMGYDGGTSNFPMNAKKVPDRQRFANRIPKLLPNQSLTNGGTIQEHGIVAGAAHTWYAGPGITNIDVWLDWFDEYAYEPFSARTAHDFRVQYNAAINGPKGGFFPFPMIGGMLESVTESLGLGEFSKTVRKNRAAIEEALDKILSLRMATIQMAIEVGIDSIVMADDSAYKQSTYISPALHRELVVPRYAKLAKEMHRAGKFFFLHSDGFTEPYFPGYIEAGIDGICTIEEGAGMDFLKLKQKYGESLTLMNPLDCSHLLCFGTPDAISQRIKEICTAGKRGGGFVNGPCTSLLDNMPLQNGYVIVEATKKYGAS